MKRIIH